MRRIDSLAHAYADLLLNDLKQAGEPPGGTTHSASASGWTVHVIVSPSPPEGPEGLTDCDHDCLTLLAQAKLPQSGVRVRKELERRGIGVWGLATVKRSLAKLRRLKLVCNSRRGQRGYFLPEAAPLVRGAA